MVAEPGGEWATGRFSTEGLTGESLDAALAWARARSDYVIVSFAESEDYSAGAKPVPDLPSWPPPGAPEFVRRRVPSQVWLDRGEDAEPIEWLVDVFLSKRAFFGMVERDAADDGEVAEIASRAGAESWDSRLLDGCIEVFAEAARRGESSWTTYVPCAYTLRLRVAAPTGPAAAAAALARVPAPEPWTVSASPRPA